MALTHLLVDFENGQPPATDVARIRGDDYRLWIFHGPHQKKFAAEMVVAWQPLGTRVQFIQSTRSGKNALDFHISFYLGTLHREDSGVDPQVTYVVVTEDGGFDALFDHMRKLGCVVGKAATIPEALVLAKSLSAGTSTPRDDSTAAERPSKGIIPAVKAAAAKAAAAKSEPARRKAMAVADSEKAIADLRQHAGNRPSDRTALQRHLMSILGNKVTVQVIHAVIKDLEQRKVVTILKSGKIEYRVPKAK